MTERRLQLPSFYNLPRAALIPQNLPSILAVAELKVEPYQTVLDMCASPGGKTSHIACLMQNKGLLIAIDKNKVKLAKLNETLSVLGVACARTFMADSSKLVGDGPIGPEDYSGDGHLMPNSFDRILLDPPCSGLGQRPCFNLGNFGDFAQYQKKLLATAQALLKPGGIIVYSTCSLNPEENEGVVSFGVNKLGLKLKDPGTFLGGPGLNLDGLDPSDSNRLRRFWPTGADDTVAFFFAVFEK